MRTTLDLDHALVRSAKQHAVGAGTTLTTVIEEALRHYLHPPRRSGRPFRLRLLTKKGRRAPRVNIADREALYEHMGGRG